MQPFRSARVLFLSEQDGIPERRLKDNLIRLCFFRNNELAAAYLARISYLEAPGINVALCIYPKPAEPDGLLERIATTFKQIFNGAEHLDILFLSNAQKLEIDKVATPFFDRSLNPHL